MNLDEMIKLCDARLGQRVRFRAGSITKGSSTIVEGEVEAWTIQRAYGKDPQPFVRVKDYYYLVSLYQTEPL